MRGGTSVGSRQESRDQKREHVEGLSHKSLVTRWSSPVARQAHNLKDVSSNLAPATNLKPRKTHSFRGFCLSLHLFHRFLLLPVICLGLHSKQEDKRGTANVAHRLRLTGEHESTEDQAQEGTQRLSTHLVGRSGQGVHGNAPHKAEGREGTQGEGKGTQGRGCHNCRVRRDQRQAEAIPLRLITLRSGTPCHSASRPRRMRTVSRTDTSNRCAAS